MIDRKLLVSDLQKQVERREKDLRERADSVDEMRLNHPLPKDECAHSWPLAAAFVATRHHCLSDAGGPVFNRSAAYPLELSREIDDLARRLARVTPAAVAASGVPTRKRLDAAGYEWHCVRGVMIGLQEELDWQVYALCGLLDEDLIAPESLRPPMQVLGERAFEIVLARKMRDEGLETQWFERHRSKPITELPAYWRPEYRTIVERRVAVIERDRAIGLIEQPEHKRRWATEGWEVMQRKALRDWLLEQCEARELWCHHVDGLEQPRPLTTAQLADELRRDADVLIVAGIYAPGQDLGQVIADLIVDEHPAPHRDH
ncbi:DUF7008 domain-containing protein [Micromonospora chalcea]|uniref:DUF7008 domain-containing protein n=1 Tax=Micromonospora chalcea TaxID=1874 RepID=UPI0037CB6A7B